jgi:hypothetical protein
MGFCTPGPTHTEIDFNNEKVPDSQDLKLLKALNFYDACRRLRFSECETAERIASWKCSVFSRASGALLYVLASTPSALHTSETLRFYIYASPEVVVATVKTLQ